jgi:hypothetical protein
MFGATEALADRVKQGAPQDPEELKRITDLITNLVEGIRSVLGSRFGNGPAPGIS